MTRWVCRPTARTTHVGRAADRGTTLIELIVVMAIFGAMTSMAVWGWQNYRRASGEQGTATMLVEALRDAQMRAQTEDVIYEVHFVPGSPTWVIDRIDPVTGNPQQVSTGTASDSSVVISAASFTQADGTIGPDAYFYPRGTASPGTLVVSRQGSGKTYTITVEGLTARVSVD